MKRILPFVLSVFFIMAMLSSCTASRADNLMNGITPRQNAADDLLYTDVSDIAVTEFALRLFRESTVEGENTLISPLSILIALSMTANGADNETLTQMQNTLGMPVSQLNPWIRRYIDGLPSAEKHKLSLANSIWFSDDDRFIVNQDFLQTNADYYSADIYKAPFDQSTVKEINQWVKGKTDGMISQILDSVSPDTIMFLINTLTFDAEWQTIYSESQIADGIFSTKDGVSRRVEMMYADEHLYLEDENATGFIKYYNGQKYAFAALLPNEDTDVLEYVRSLRAEHLNHMLNNAKVCPVNTAIPSFSCSYQAEMIDILRSMGITDLFDPAKADLSLLGRAASEEENLFVSRILHKTYINVDARGTKAGAVTAITVTCTSAVIDNPKTVYLDRPFVYMLIDCENNIPLFIGTLMDTEEG
ncbi:MAG: serpin family protein [Clostridia bacterium]|nr:serpin family protein [Clostridia bacterium]